MSNDDLLKGVWYVVKYENGMLTTCRDGHRYEDFELDDDGVQVFANKHFGDHEYDSGTVVDVRHDGTTDKLNTLMKAAVEFHQDYMWWTIVPNNTSPKQ